ncbi:MAG: SBBP repeat-containing protein [Bacteroidetes bacterium]|nr:SBBP repeat-containing protein [Bacteroidota bacterium]
MNKQRTINSIFVFLLLSGNNFAQVSAAYGSSDNEQAKTITPLRGNGISFTPNKGQVADAAGDLRPDVLYKGEGGGSDIYIRKTGISYVLSNVNEVTKEIIEKAEESEKLNDSKVNTVQKVRELWKEHQLRIHRVDMDFVDGNARQEVITYDQLEGYSNYYYAHCPQGITYVNSYNAIMLRNVYNEIDVKYYGGKENGLKYDIVVNPGGDPAQIKLKYTGVQNITYSEGKLTIKTSVNDIEESIPKVYQNINGHIVNIEAQYILAEDYSSSAPNAQHSYYITFKLLSDYDTRFPLIIDPWATYYSGPGLSSGSGLAADGLGNVIFTGRPGSNINFPISAGAFQITGGGNVDAFLAKFSINGTRIFGTYFGGANNERGYGVATDKNNDILLSGSTASGNCPVKNPGGGAYAQAFGGGTDAFVAKFTPAGLLTWAVLYGGSSTDEGYDVITDAANNVIVVGYTESSNFPVLSPFQGALSGTQDAFAVKFNSGCVRQWATYFGGSANDDAVGVASDGASNIFITGETSSNNLPLAAAGFQPVFGGGVGLLRDVYLVKLNGVTGFPAWSTYYGGSGYDWAAGVATDAVGNCVITGTTASANNISSVGSNQMALAGSNDAFIAKFTTAGARLWGTYHGGPAEEVTGSCAIDIKDNIYWYGEVEDDKPNPSWISVCAYQNTYNGTEDHLISKFDPNGKLICTTAVGGPLEEDYDAGVVYPHYDIAAYDPFIYITAHVRGGGYPVSPGAFQTASGSGGGLAEAFVNQLCSNICQQKFLNTNATASQTVICPNVPISFTSTVNNACDTTDLRFKWTFTGASPNTSTISNPVITYASPGFYTVKLVVSTPCQKDSVLKTNYIIVNPCTINAAASKATICSGSCSNITATGSSGTSPYTYSWSSGGTSATINVCPVTTTDYTVMITDALGNYAATTTSITVYTPLVATSSSTNISCTTSGSASVNVSSGTTPYVYSWSNGIVTGPTSAVNSSISNLIAGGYTLTIRDSNGCTQTKTYNITGVNPVSATFTYPMVCLGVPVTFTNTGSTGTYNWVISPITPANVSGTTTDFSYTFLTTGTYSISHTVTSAGCNNTVVQNITVTNCTGPVVTTTGSSICSGSCATVTSNGAGGSGPYTYSWNNAATTQNINPCPVSTTTYTVTITDAGGNTSTSTAVVTVNPGADITITATNITCNGSADGAIAATGTSGISPYTYNWNNGQTVVTATGLSPGSYTVTVTDNKGCTSTSSATIISPPALIGQFTKGTASCTACGCKQWIMINVSGGTGPYLYSWPDGYVNRYKNQLCPGAYMVNIKDKNGCSINTTITAP